MSIGDIKMAVRYEDQCVDCELPCLGNSCPNRNVPIWYCDECGDEGVDLYEVDGKEVCAKCALQMLPMIHHE